MKRKSIWRENSDNVPFLKLEGNMEADVVIVGGGISGLTAAYKLIEAGRSVALLEALEIGSGSTGLSSCHLTTHLDEQYRNIAIEFGEETAASVAASRVGAIDIIERTIKKFDIKCDFRRLPGYWYTEEPESVSDLREEFQFASNAKLDVKLTDSIPLRFAVNKALVFNNQAEFNSQQYLLGLAENLMTRGAWIFENSRVVSVEEHGGKYIIKTESGAVTANSVFVATHIPIFRNVLQSMVSPHMTYMIAAKLRSPEHPVGLFWDTAKPYHYTRYYNTSEGSFVVVGGEDHKTGNEPNTLDRFAKLEQYIRDRFDIISIDYKWSAQYYEPADGLPYIGKSPFAKNIYVATGFSGDGLVYGTIAGSIIADLIAGIENPWHKLYDATRFTPAASAAGFIKENADVAKHFIKDRIVPEVEDLSEIYPGEGKIIKYQDQKLAVARDEDGQIYALSPACPHMKCFVNFNNAEQTWDCPCHGSRFSLKGEVIYGPSVISLTQKSILHPEKKNED